MKKMATDSGGEASSSPSRLPSHTLSQPRHFYLAVDRLPFKMETLVDLLGVVGRRSGLPIVVCCTSRDQLDAVSSTLSSLPFISLSSLQLSQFLSAPRTTYTQAATHVVRDLKGTIATYPANANPCIQGFTYVDWGNCPYSVKSPTGYCIFLGPSLVSWKTKKQKTVSKSSAESECRAMSATASELEWLTSLLHDLIPVSLPITLHCDNRDPRQIAANPVFHERTKRLRLDCHYVRDKMLEGFIHPLISLRVSNLRICSPKYSDLAETERALVLEKFRHAALKWHQSSFLIGDGNESGDVETKSPMVVVTDVCLPIITSGESPLPARVLINYELPAKKEIYMRRMATCLTSDGIVINMVVGGEVVTLKNIEESSNLIVAEMPIQVSEIL